MLEQDLLAGVAEHRFEVAGRAFTALPPPLARTALRLVGDRRVLDGLDVEARAAYDARLSGNL